jgi:ferredoxin
MRITLWSLVALGAAVFLFYGCEGPEGPPGAQGPAGPPGQPDSVATYLGDNSENCAHCHDAMITSWMTTPHSLSHDSLLANPSYTELCNECHSTGWDVALNNGGYDDAHDPALANVQCEACHGPMGPNPALHQPNLTDAMSGAACAGCHILQTQEWSTSLHGTTVETHGGTQGFITEWGSATCNPCHTGQGFLHAYDAVGYPAVPTFSDGKANGISCGVCHDSHQQQTNTQLRAQTTITLPYPANFTINNFGVGQMCGNCHHDRRTAANMSSQMSGGSTHYGPHESPQADIVAGTGSYVVDTTYNYDVTPNQHDGILTDMCVDCHVKVVTTPGSGHPTAAGHTFLPQVATCASACHSGAADFNIGGVQTHTDSLMEALAALVVGGNSNLTLPLDAVQIGDTSMSTVLDRKVSWAYFKVERDKSRGVHNRDYTWLILQNSIDYYNANSLAAEPRKPNSWTSR